LKIQTNYDGAMGCGADTAREGPDRAAVSWLDADERQAWLGLVGVVTRLPPLLDAELQRDAGLNFFEYTVLAMLSEQGDRMLRMTRLAAVTNASPSRLSHAVRQLEARGLVVREDDPEDGRCVRARLTRRGEDVVRSAAPGHVATVRRLVIDAIGPDRLEGLRRATDAILRRVDPEGTGRPTWPVPVGGTGWTGGPSGPGEGGDPRP